MKQSLRAVQPLRCLEVPRHCRQARARWSVSNNRTVMAYSDHHEDNQWHHVSRNVTKASSLWLKIGYLCYVAP